MDIQSRKGPAIICVGTCLSNKPRYPFVNTVTDNLVGANINLGTISASKTTNIVWQVNDKSGEQITNYKTVAYVGGK